MTKKKENKPRDKNGGKTNKVEGKANKFLETVNVECLSRRRWQWQRQQQENEKRNGLRHTLHTHTRVRSQTESQRLFQDRNHYCLFIAEDRKWLMERNARVCVYAVRVPWFSIFHRYKKRANRHALTRTQTTFSAWNSFSSNGMHVSRTQSYLQIIIYSNAYKCIGIRSAAAWTVEWSEYVCLM